MTKPIKLNLDKFKENQNRCPRCNSSDITFDKNQHKLFYECLNCDLLWQFNKQTQKCKQC